MRSRLAPPTVIPWNLPPPDNQSSSDSYRHALSRIYAFSEAPRSAEEIALGRERKLDRMRALLGLLGFPQARFGTVLVAGTKGKGSTAAMLASIVAAAGVRVGRYTQPHLYSYRERTWACGRYIEEHEIAKLLDSMAEALALIERGRGDLGPLTTFDVGTALSLLHFARKGVELAVVEVGVGGANDATNVLEPILAVIGPVGLDHVDTLGHSLVDVARAKAGVLRRGIDAVVADQEPCVEETIGHAAEELGARLFQARAEAPSTVDPECPFHVLAPDVTEENLTTPLAGGFQRTNAAMAVTAAQLLRRGGLPVTPAAIRGGLRDVQWPGRFQTVVRQPLTIVDGAHNPCAARALAETVKGCLPGHPLTLVLGISREKDVASTVAELAPLAHRVVVTRARHERSCDPEELAEVVRSVAPRLEVATAPSAGEALCTAWSAQPEDGATIVTGSLFLVGDVLEWLLPYVGDGAPGPADRGQGVGVGND